MVQKILNIFNKEFVGLHQAAYVLGVFALFSQLLALVRDRLLAHFFGAGATLDIYYAAFRIPDFIYISIASFVSITVLIPFIAQKLGDDENDKEQNKKNAQIFLNNVFTVFLFFVIVVDVIIFFLVPELARVVAPGLVGEAKQQFILLTRILLVSPVLLGISSLLGSVTQTFRRFFVYASGPIFYNMGIIIGIITLQSYLGIMGVILGVILGALLHLLIQLPTIMRIGLLPKFVTKIDFSEIKRVIYLSLPRTITLSSGQIALIALVALASFMADGSISVFNFSFNLQSVPLSVIGVSYSVAAFPTLARLFSKGEMKMFTTQVIVAARHIIFWSTPAIILFIVLRAQIVRSILGTGAFDWSDTRLTAAALAVFAVSVLAQALVLLFVRGYYAAGRTRIPLFINISSSVLIIWLGFLFVDMFQNNILFQYLVESLLRIEGLQGSVIVMLPLAYSVGMIVNAILLWVFFKHDFAEFKLSLERVFVHSFAASIIMGFVAYRFLIMFGDIFNLETFLGIFAQGLLSGLIGIAAGILTLFILGNKEIKEVSATFHRRLRGIPAVAPDQEEL